MIWKNGYTARYHYSIVDPMTWRDMETHEMTGGSISRSGGLLQESAIIESGWIPAGETWVRIYLDARQGESGAREALFTGLMQSPGTEWDGLRKTQSAECYSVLKPADDILLARGWYIPAGLNGARAAADLLMAGAAPVTWDENGPSLADTIIAEDGESNLSMAQKIITAIGWRIRISGNGEIRITPKAKEASALLDTRENDIIELKTTDTRDWFLCPNVFRAISGDLTAVAKDDNETSPYSVTSRGREVWMEEKDCSLSENESIAEYAMRRLREEQSPARTLKYTRRFLPGIVPGDIVRINIPGQKISGKFQISSQKTELGFSARTEEEAEEI